MFSSSYFHFRSIVTHIVYTISCVLANWPKANHVVMPMAYANAQI